MKDRPPGNSRPTYNSAGTMTARCMRRWQDLYPVDKLSQSRFAQPRTNFVRNVSCKCENQEGSSSVWVGQHRAEAIPKFKLVWTVWKPGEQQKREKYVSIALQTYYCCTRFDNTAYILCRHGTNAFKYMPLATPSAPVRAAAVSQGATSEPIDIARSMSPFLNALDTSVTSRLSLFPVCNGNGTAKMRYRNEF